MLPHDKHCVRTQPVGRWVFTEVAMIGNGGVVGIVLMMGNSASASSRGAVQSAGQGFRIRAGVLHASAGELRRICHCHHATSRRIIACMSGVKNL